MNNKKYTKILVAKYSPKNGCHATEGEVLIVKPPVKEPGRELTYSFEGVETGKKSRYGWVKTVPEYTLDGFIDGHLENVLEKEREYLNCMFDVISKLGEGVPVAVDFRQKSMGEAVLFYTCIKSSFTTIISSNNSCNPPQDPRTSSWQGLGGCLSGGSVVGPGCFGCCPVRRRRRRGGFA